MISSLLAEAVSELFKIRVISAGKERKRSYFSFLSPYVLGSPIRGSISPVASGSIPRILS